MECPQCRQECPCLYNRKMIEELVVTRIERMMCKECTVGVDSAREIPDRVRHEVIYRMIGPSTESQERFRHRVQALFGDDMAALADKDTGLRDHMALWFYGGCSTYRGWRTLLQILAAKLATPTRIERRLDAAKLLAHPAPPAPRKAKAPPPPQQHQGPTNPSTGTRRRHASGAFALCAVTLFILLIGQQCLRSVLTRRSSASPAAERSSRTAPLPTTLPPVGTPFHWTPGPGLFWIDGGLASGSKSPQDHKSVSGSSSTK